MHDNLVPVITSIDSTANPVQAVQVGHEASSLGMLPRRKGRTKLPSFKVKRYKGIFYIAIPEDYRDLEGQTKYSGPKVDMEIRSEELRAKYARHPSLALNPKGALDIFEKIQAADYKGTLEQLLQECLELRLALNADPTFEECLEMKIDDCKKRNKLAQAQRYMQFRLPWVGKRLAEFKDKTAAGKAIDDITKFLDKQIDERNGNPWQEMTKSGWTTLFNGVINYSIAKIKTKVLDENPFKKSFDYESDKIGREIFNLDELKLFLNYLYHVRPELYVPFVLATWGCIRTTEVSRLTIAKINLGSEELKNGLISLDSGITKTDYYREIAEKDVPHLFFLLRAARHLLGEGKGLVVKIKSWHMKLTKCFRELFGRPYPSNASRSTGASNLLIGTDMPTCGRVMGHDFLQIDKVLLNFYKEHVTLEGVARFMSLAPEPFSDQLMASIKWQMYTLKTPVTASTVAWPNYQMKCMDLTMTANQNVVLYLQNNRPFFASAVGKLLEVAIQHRNGTYEEKSYQCKNRKDARRRQHQWRVAILTRLGDLNFVTGEVDNYHLNFGPFWKQKAFQLERPSQLWEAMQASDKNVLQVAQIVGCSTDFLCRYAGFIGKRNKDTSPGVPLPEKYKERLLALFPDLRFVPTVLTSTKLAWVSRGGTKAESKTA